MTKKKDQNKGRKIRLILHLFSVYFGVLLLMSGIHIGFLVLMNKYGCGEIVQTLVAMGYWGLVAIGLTWFTISQIENTYEMPMRRLADATAKVAAGDFSVYVPTIHTADKIDYIDIMITDFNKMVEELGSIETLKTDFVSNVSHEMKTPIAIIKNYAELLEAGQIPDETRIEYAESIESAATRLSNLIGNILRLNRLEHQRITPELESYDLCRQLCDCVLQFEDAWEEKNIELEMDVEDRAVIRADESLMELVWNNLISNAIKFMEPGGCLKVRQITDLEKGQLVVAVSDTGCGMSKENVTHIFDKFYQGDTSHAKEGNGLGLALVKRVLELMGGSICVISEEGKGSTFTVTMPAAEIHRNRGGVRE